MRVTKSLTRDEVIEIVRNAMKARGHFPEHMIPSTVTEDGQLVHGYSSGEAVIEFSWDTPC